MKDLGVGNEKTFVAQHSGDMPFELIGIFLHDRLHFHRKLAAYNEFAARQRRFCVHIHISRRFSHRNVASKE
jgi:hypothetical protein